MIIEQNVIEQNVIECNRTKRKRLTIIEQNVRDCMIEEQNNHRQISTKFYPMFHFQQYISISIRNRCAIQCEFRSTRSNTHCATSRKVAGSIPDGVVRIFIDVILLTAL